MYETWKSFEHDPVKVIDEKGARKVPGRTSAMSTHVTIVACVNAILSSIHPFSWKSHIVPFGASLVLKPNTDRSV
jgi:hypothetical protein